MKKLFLSGLLFLTACGFSPLYQQVSFEEGSTPVHVAPIPDQYGFEMRQIIQAKLGEQNPAKYTLTVSSPTFDSWDQTIDNKNFATLMGVSGTVAYRLTDNATQKTVLDSSVSLNSSYSVVQDPYATVTAERKTKRDLANQLANQVSIHVLAFWAGVDH